MFFLKPLIKSEIGGGVLLIGGAVVALLWANSPLAPGYFATLEAYFAGISILHWINDALMAIFFLLVGLEIKRELMIGELATRSARVLPGFAALGGMAIPALIYVAVNFGSVETFQGWAIPAATDIAFSLGILALLGSRVPNSLKLFLTALAILDDLGAVLIIALFYTADISATMLGLSALVLGALLALNLARVNALWPYLLLGAVLWFFVFKSGIHATVAGVLLAVTIPIEGKDSSPPPLARLEHALQPLVTYLILPIFALANAGVAFGGMAAGVFFSPVAAGVALGLFAGKQIGVFASVWLVVRAGLADLPAGIGWAQLYGVALLCGIGFTISIFISLLAFESPELQEAAKIGVLAGSLASAVAGWLVLWLSGRGRLSARRRPASSGTVGRGMEDDG